MCYEIFDCHTVTFYGVTSGEMYLEALLECTSRRTTNVLPFIAQGVSQALARSQDSLFDVLSIIAN